MPTLRYYAVFGLQTRTWPAVNLVVRQLGAGEGMRAVIWNHREQAWTFSPATAESALAYDDMEDEQRFEEVDRPRAREIALTLGTKLPAKEELHRICREGAAEEPHPIYHGWTLRRPPETWSYYAAQGYAGESLTLIVVKGGPGPCRALAWRPVVGRWVFDSPTIFLFLHQRHSWIEVDRSRAEEIALLSLWTELPSEAQLQRMCDAVGSEPG